MNDKELVHELVLESREHLQTVEPDLLTLEREGGTVSDALINRIFRAVHSIKGGFSFFGISQITDLAHAMENVLSRIRDHALTVAPQVTDALLKGIDKLRVLLDDIENTGNISISNELQALQPFRADIPSGSQTSVISPGAEQDILRAHPIIDNQKLSEFLKSGKHLYRIFLRSSYFEMKNLPPSSLIDAWAGIGEIIDVNIDHHEINGIRDINTKQITYIILFSSVLEPDLLGTGCNIENDMFQEIDIKRIINNKPAEKFSETPAASSPLKEAVAEKRSQEDTLRVRVSLLNNLMNLAGELVLSRNQLLLQFNGKLADYVSIENTDKNIEKDFEAALKIIKDNINNSQVELARICQNEIERLYQKFKVFLSMPLKDIPGISTTLQSVDSVTTLLQENIMQTRLQPISVVFNKFPRVVRDLSNKLGKEINLEMSGQNVELDKSIVELLSDPLTHLVRNSADHGIETIDERIARGKPSVGTISLLASQEGGKVLVEISDDGRGLDTQRIKEVALARGIVSEKSLSEMSSHEIQMLIMQPGFSTAREVSDISGRGVGMDVVKSNIERLGGTISIESVQGKGSRITLTLPLTLAIIPTLIVSAEGRTFAIPQVSVEELLRIRSFELTQKIERIHGAEVTRLRGKLLPLVRLSSVLDLQPTFIHPVTGERLPDRRARWSDRRGKPGDQESQEKKDERRTGKGDRRESVNNAVKVVVLKTGHHLYGLAVDSVYESEEIVVKPLPDSLKSTQCYAGATIMGDGKVAMILDPGGISQKAGLHFTDLEQTNEAQGKNGKDELSNNSEILLFDNGTRERFGIDLCNIARIEQADNKQIEIIGNREFLNHEGKTLPLIRLHDFLPVNRSPESSEAFYVIIPRYNERNVGIIAGQIYDTIDTELNLDSSEIKGKGILGSMLINNHLTIMLDIPTLISHFIKQIEVNCE